jgi:Retroviral aspartyl protease
LRGSRRDTRGSANHNKHLNTYKIRRSTLRAVEKIIVLHTIPLELSWYHTKGTYSWKNTTFEQRKALGLCHKCNEKYFPVHKCIPKLLNSMEANEGSDNTDSENEEGGTTEENVTEVEQAIVSMFDINDNKAVKIMKFKGKVDKMSVCALLDSGSTHFFVNPTVLQGEKIKVTQIVPMMVTLANGAKMVTDLYCEDLQFQIQGYEFERNVRVLDVQGYDMILGLDWLTNFGPMKINWGKGSLKFKHKGKKVKL